VAIFALSAALPAIGAPSPISIAKKAIKTAKAATTRSKKAVAAAKKPGPTGPRGPTGLDGGQGPPGADGGRGADAANGQAGNDAGETDSAGATISDASPVSVSSADQVVMTASITTASARRIFATATITATESTANCRVNIGDTVGQAQTVVVGTLPAQRPVTFSASADKIAGTYDVRLVCQPSFTVHSGDLSTWAVGQ
jgi:hypothetical protein